MPLLVGLRLWEILLLWCTLCLASCWLMGKGKEGGVIRWGMVAGTESP